MKKFLVVIGLLSLSTAQAAEHKVFDVTTKFARPHMTSQTFGINADLGRSWVEINVSRGSYQDDADMDDKYRVQIPGLSYDKATETIYAESEGQIVECARNIQKGRSIFKRKILELTDRCRFEQRTKVLSKDNGFEIVKDERFQVFLIID